MYLRIILLILLPIFGFSQAPQKINFQSILRNTNGEVVANKAVSLRISILSGSITGNTVYSETHGKTTDASGLISLQIGNGTLINGAFSAILWGNAAYFIKLEADFNGGSNYVLLGTQELMSVPYALYASKTDTSVFNLANRFNSKVNVSDTASMLTNYRNELINKVNTSDTFFMLTNYWTGLNNKVNISDTSTMLNPYLRKSDSIIANLQNQDKLLQSFSSVTDIDGNKYKTVKIGTQVWMSENLKTSRYRNGDVIPVVTDNTAWIGLASGARCWFENDSSTYENNYGNLYNSFAATDLRGICPLGWHLPTYQDWETLTYFLGGTGNGGGKMKFSGTTFWSNPNTDANNESGFTALPSGYRSNIDGGGSFTQSGKDFWMVLIGQLNVLHFRNLHYASNSISGPNAFGYWNHFNETSGVSIRCLKDPEIDIDQSLNIKVNIADTSSMLNPYLRKADAIVSVETDRVFNASVAKGISSIDTAYWNRKTGNTPGNIQYWNGTTWVNLAPGLPGQILSTDNTGKPVWLSTLPLISTNSVSDINPNAATCGGNITSDGGSPVTGRGVVWSINPNPTISLSTKTSNGLGIGVFTSSMTGLTSNVVYYVRAYVTNSVGTIYGNEIIFTTTANIPMLTTTSVQSITTNGAISGGNISSDGGSPVTVRGTVWSTSVNPTIALSNKTSDGSGLGTFSSAITGLSPNTTYYVKSYATNTAGTGYGNETTFRTEIGALPPTVTTSTASEVSYLTFTTGGNVTFDGGSTVTARGIIWSQTQIPTISMPTKTVNGSGNGSFTSYMFDLTPNTVYYVRSYATNSAGTGYGMTDTVQTRTWVNCPGNISDIDNNEYNVVTIGYQCWTKENMKVSKYSNGDEIPIIINGVIWASLSTGSRSWYLNDSVSYENPYGNLYNWYAASDSRGICPTGWHVPTDSEWTNLTDYLGGEGVAGGKMKATGNAYEEGNIGASNSSEFTGYGGGFREGIQEPGYFDGQFGRIKLDARFWSSSSFNNPWAWSQALYYYNQTIGRGPEKKGRGFSVRCLRD